MDKLKVFIIILLVAAVFAGCVAGTVAISDPTEIVTTEPVTEKATEKPTEPTTVEVIATTAPATEDINETDPSDDNSDSEPEHKPEKKPKPPADPSKKRIAFTFDDGPHWELTKMFVDKLAEYNGVGTFFVVGNRIHGDQQEGMKYAYDHGNEIGVHAWTHQYYYNTCSESTFYNELTQTANKIQEVTGEYPLTMRPVGGGITDERIASSGFVVINWNVDSNDWRYTSDGYEGINAMYSNVIDYVDGNDIILFHEIYYNSYDAFCEVIDALYNEGYEFVTVSQLLQLDDSDRGTFYASGY